jgi:hypothetical protein
VFDNDPSDELSSLWFTQIWIVYLNIIFVGSLHFFSTV